MKIVGESKLPAAQFAMLAAAVKGLPAGASVLEIGTYQGATAAMLADAVPQVSILSIDRYASPKVDPAFWFKNRRPNMALYVGTAQTLVEYGLFVFALVLIDAMHTYEAVLADLASSTRMMTTASRLFLHDYDPERWPGVVKAIDEWCAVGEWRIGAKVQTLVELVRREA